MSDWPEDEREPERTTAASRVSRRAWLGSGLAVGGGVAALALSGTRGRLIAAQGSPAAGTAVTNATPVLSPAGTSAASPFANDVDVLNYALALEHLEAAFYRDGLDQFAADAFTALDFQASVRDYLAQIAGDEDDHVATLEKAITQLGGAPVGEASYKFGYTDLESFLKLAMAIENLGVAAYTGAASYLKGNRQLLTTALTIQGVEGRHAAYLNLLNSLTPFPDAFNAPERPAEVLQAAGHYIVGPGTPAA